MKKIIIALCVGIILTLATGVYAKVTQENIASSLVRLHIIANSDSAQDQEVKLKVRDAIIAGLGDKLKDVSSPQDAEKIILENMDYIESIAKTTLSENGFDYGAVPMLGNYEFPAKQYGNITLPPGQYDALRVVLGSGSGQNWWCVMFPPLCFVDQTKGEAPADSLETLKNSMSDDSYEIITSSDASAPVQFRFKILELWDEFTKNR